MADRLLPEPGDIVVLNGIGYCHWAIVSGKGRLIHVTAANDEGSSLIASIESSRNKSSKAAVKEQLVDASDAIQYMLRFFHVDNSLDSQIDPFPAAEIVARARSKLGPWDYDVGTNNCEHFAKWCRYGVTICQQLPYNYQTRDSGGVGLGSFTVGPARVHLPSVHAKEVNERGRKGLEISTEIVGAELSFVKANIRPAVKAGFHNTNGLGFTSEVKVAEARAGPVAATLGLGVSTGIRDDEHSVGVQVLGTGFDFGKDEFKMGVSVFGSRAECSIM